MENLKFERICALTLNRVFGYVPRISSSIVASLGSAAAFFRLSPGERDALAGAKYRGQLNDGELEKSEREMDALEREGVTFISRTEGCFPKLLSECEDSPAGLYVKASCPPEEVFNRAFSVSVVGTRDISFYGKDWCPRIIRALASSTIKPTIVSGLAFGVDITAHMSALAFGLPTIAVLPTGIDEIYPRSHRVAAGKICSSPGSALVTDYPPGTGPAAFNFLRRNRLIAGLSNATILVESREKGGGTMTTRLAHGYGREVFALPGRIDDVCSAGCNRLIRENIAGSITDISSLVEDIGLGTIQPATERSPVQMLRAAFPEGLPDNTARRMESILAMVQKRPHISVEQLCSVLSTAYETMLSDTFFLSGHGLLDIDLAQRCSINMNFF